MSKKADLKLFDSNSSIYIQNFGITNMVFIAIYINNTFITGLNIVQINNLKVRLSNHFQIKYLSLYHC